MAPFGYLFILIGALLIRQVAVGRANELPDDARDFANALLSGKPEDLQGIMARRGKNVAEVSESGSGSDGSNGFTPAVDDLLTSATSSPKAQAFVSKVRALGSAAKGYKLGATGPEYYDCSGILWRAALDTKLYNGSRFTTSSFTSIAPAWCAPVSSPLFGDIVLWAGSHMGVCTGGDGMYSARSPAKGIGQSTISGDASFFGRQPTYWRIK